MANLRLNMQFSGCQDSLLDMLNNIRLATVLEESKTRGQVKALYQLEETSEQENRLLEVLELKNVHNERPKLKGVGVYT